MRSQFNRLADRVNVGLGSLWALILSVIVVIVWALSGPVFNFSDTWQLFINTGTTVVTLWMVFVIQNGQNRASKAVQLKLDEVFVPSMAPKTSSSVSRLRQRACWRNARPRWT